MKIRRYIKILGIFPKFKNRKHYDLIQACSIASFRLQLSFYTTSIEKLLKIWNGIGASGRWYNRFIPKQVWGLNIELCSLPHDFDYDLGGTELDKQRADKRFLKNILIWIDINTENEVLRELRRASAYKFYVFVRLFGHKFFNYK